MDALYRAASLIPVGTTAAVSAAMTWGIKKLVGDHHADQTAQTIVSSFVSQLNQTGEPPREVLEEFGVDGGWPNFVFLDISLDALANKVLLNLSQINETVSTEVQNEVEDEFNHFRAAVSVMAGSVALGTFVTAVYCYRNDSLKDIQQSISKGWAWVTHALTAASTCAVTYGATTALSNPHTIEVINHAAPVLFSQLGNLTGAPLPTSFKQICEPWQGTIYSCNITKVELAGGSSYDKSTIQGLVNATAQTLVDSLSDTGLATAIGMTGAAFLTVAVAKGCYWVLFGKENEKSDLRSQQNSYGAIEGVGQLSFESTTEGVEPSEEVINVVPDSTAANEESEMSTSPSDSPTLSSTVENKGLRQPGSGRPIPRRNPAKSSSQAAEVNYDAVKVASQPSNEHSVEQTVAAHPDHDFLEHNGQENLTISPSLTGTSGDIIFGADYLEEARRELDKSTGN